MLSRIISKPSYPRLLKQISSKTIRPSISNPHISHSLNPQISNPNHYFHFFSNFARYFSTNSNGDGKDRFSSDSDVWKLSSENEHSVDSFFGKKTGSLDGIHDGSTDEAAASRGVKDEPWLSESNKSGFDEDGGGNNIFKGTDEKSSVVAGAGDDEWATADGFKPWDFAMEQKEEDVFDIGVDTEEGSHMSGFADGNERAEIEKSKKEKQLESEEKALTAVLKGPNRAFGDLIAASGITDAMLDSLIALKDLEDVEGLPPLREIEDMRYERNTRKSTRAEIELQKQEEIAKARVRQVDAKGRAYGTGRRKCSIARVWVQPGDGKFFVNDKQFDVYFPMLDHRAALLRPFVETKSLGHWDIKCTVKGGGMSGQVGAIQLGISRALQNWEPELRPPLRQAGFLTRDSRVVERKKPGKAKARKSFQWVKR